MKIKKQVVHHCWASIQIIAGAWAPETPCIWHPWTSQ